jgi:glycosyltransferase domain-containing protein
MVHAQGNPSPVIGEQTMQGWRRGKAMSKLTIIIPTRDRPRCVAAQLRFFRDCGLRKRIIVADESGAEHTEAVRTACQGIAAYHHFEQDAYTSVWSRFGDKILKLLPLIETPYVVMTPDDDITLPHAMEQSVAYLDSHESYSAARGYWLGFRGDESSFDLYEVNSFTPSIDDDDPLVRMHRLMSRYQPFVWSVFRVEELATALAASMTAEGVLFQELMFMNAAVCRGKVARLPVIFGLTSQEESIAPRTETQPLDWFLHDPEDFIDTYYRYRLTLARHVAGLGIAAPQAASLDQLLDIFHAIWLSGEVDRGTLNHAAQRILDNDVAGLRTGAPRRGWNALGPADLVHPSPIRRYIWRESLIAPELRHEITLTPEEMARVERQLDCYL